MVSASKILIGVFNMSDNIGVYIHIPFCRSKCYYCDFFSGKAKEEDFDKYTALLKERIKYWGNISKETVSSVYIGGGTPSILGAERLCDILTAVEKSFKVSSEAEITVEVNPESGKSLDFNKLRKVGFNRISIGMQSSHESELKALGRIHSPEDVRITVKAAKDGGFKNISLDIMMGIPNQTLTSLKKSIDFCAFCGVTHVSSYILKIEPGTKLYSEKEKLSLPSEDETAELYLSAVDYLERLGYNQYEISNFAVPTFESRHNTLYWKCGEYIGIGPSAHSFYKGKRFHYERDIKQFAENITVEDGTGGNEEEFIMLSLRLKTGLVFKEYEERYNKVLSPVFKSKIKKYTETGFLEGDDNHVCFTPKGFLVSNSIICDLI